MPETTIELDTAFGADGSFPKVAPPELGERSQSSQAMKEAARLVRTIYEGTEAMRKAGVEYLPKEPGESKPAHSSRLKRSFLYNAIARAVQVLAGKPFSKPILLGADVPEAVVRWAENIDMTGRHLSVLARELFTDALLDGVSFFLVDMAARPRDKRGRPIRLSKAQAEAANRRPYWIGYRADEVIGWRSEIRNGSPFLTQVRLKIQATRPADQFREETVESVLVLVPGGWAVYVEAGEGQEGYRLADSGRTSLDVIPFVPVYAKRAEFMAGSPPLADLAQLNLAHWQSASDQRHILHVARVPILFGKGFELQAGEVLEVGANRLIARKERDASLEFVEITGKSIESGRQDLLDLEAKMSDLAMKMLIPKVGDVTATQAGIEAAEAHSALQAMAEALGDALEIGLVHTAQLAGLGAVGGSVKVHTDFAAVARDAESKLLSEMEQRGQISRGTLWHELKRRDLLSDAFDPDEEERRLDARAEDSLEVN